MINVNQNLITEPCNLFISVAIATFNGEKFIEQLICSIASQSMKPNEVIISDDCSSDNTLYVARKVLSQCNLEFKIYDNKERLGFENNFLRAMRFCQGDLIFIADQDDLWMPNKISKIYDAAIKMPYNDVFLHDAYVCDANLWITHVSLFNSINSSFNDFAYGFCMAIRQRIVKLFPSSLLPIGHDLIINNVALCLNSKCYLSDRLAFYRRHENAFTYHTFRAKSVRYKKFLYFDVSLHTKSVLASEIVLFMVHKALSGSHRYSMSDNIAISKVEKSKVEESTRLVYMTKSSFSRLLSIVRSFFIGNITLFHALKDLLSVVSES
jgi:glycosyltransferase involved in cell wall biosynthesis